MTQTLTGEPLDDFDKAMGLLKGIVLRDVELASVALYAPPSEETMRAAHDHAHRAASRIRVLITVSDMFVNGR